MFYNNPKEEFVDSQSAIIYRVRFPLIVFIVYLHSSGDLEHPEIPIIQSGLYDIVQTIISRMVTHSAVPTFFFISGFLMFYGLSNFTKDAYIKKMRNRITRLLIPYFLWNIIALIISILRIVNDGMSIENAVSSCCRNGFLSCFWVYNTTGDADIDILGNVTHLGVPVDMPLWYLRDLIVMSIISPLFYICIKRIKLLIVFIAMSSFLAGFYTNLPGFSSMAIAFYSMGAYFSIMKIDFSTFFRKCFMPAIAIYLFLLLFILFTYESKSAFLFFPVFRLFGVFVIFGIADRFIRNKQPVLPPIFPESSFFIYAIHYIFFLSFVDKLISLVLPPSNELTHTLQYLISPAIRIMIYIVIYILLKKIAPKTAKLLTGISYENKK